MPAVTAPALRYVPQPTQHNWHACTAYEAGFGGSKGGGKSLGLLMEAVRYAGHPRYRGIIFRRDYPRLSELMDRARDWLPITLKATWHDSDHAWVFPSGGRLLMRHCQYEEDKRAYNGHEYQFMGFDQLEEFTETQYTYLLAQNRSGVKELQPYTRATFNPGGIGHAWVKKYFIEHGTTDCRKPKSDDETGTAYAPWRPVNDAGTPLSTRCFHRSGIDDNPALLAADPTYRMRLEALPVHERRALLEGDWDIFAGQYFPEWRRDLHVCRPFQVPREWVRWRGVDYGFNAPMCCLWFARSGEGQTFVYRELYATSLLDREQGVHIGGMSGGEMISVTYADPSMWNTQPNGTTIAQAYAQAGIWCSKANNDRRTGWQRVHEALMTTPPLQVFETCDNLIRTLPALIHDPHKVEDVDTDGEDHAPDALRYGLMGGARMAAGMNQARSGTYGISR